MSPSTLNPYLFFPGNCEQALDFYRSALGAEIDMCLKYRDCPEPMPPGSVPEGYDDKVLHASLRIGDAMLMASDEGCGGATGFSGVSLSLSCDDEATLRRRFDALAEGGHVQMSPGKTFFSPCFGSVTDRFGVSWMLIVPAPESA